jgi:L-asparaginase
MTIKIFVTGGTLDKIYDPLTGQLGFKQSYITEMLARGRCQADVSVEILMLKDSLEMKDVDRALIVKQCHQCATQRIIITHGTDTMVDTAQQLGAQIQDKVIILMGAMIPYTLSHSDSLFNLGFALGMVQTLNKGVYIAMNGRIFTWDKVKKDRQQGLFTDGCHR